MARYDDLNTSMIGYSTLLSSILLLAIILGVQALSYNWQNAEDERKLMQQEYRSSSAVLKQQYESLNGYQLVKEPLIEEPTPGSTPDPTAEPKMVDRIQIPITEAMKIVVESAKSEGDKGI